MAPAPARPDRLRQIRRWIAAERRQTAWDRRWARRLGSVFAVLIGAFLLLLLYRFGPW